MHWEFGVKEMSVVMVLNVQEYPQTKGSKLKQSLPGWILSLNLINPVTT